MCVKVCLAFAVLAAAGIGEIGSHCPSPLGMGSNIISALNQLHASWGNMRGLAGGGRRRATVGQRAAPVGHERESPPSEKSRWCSGRVVVVVCFGWRVDVFNGSERN